jgi:hypothetical protein
MDDVTAKQNALAVQLVAATKKAELLKIELDHAQQELDMTVEQKKRLADMAGALKAQNEAQLAEHEVLLRLWRFCCVILYQLWMGGLSMVDGGAKVAAAVA